MHDGFRNPHRSATLSKVALALLIGLVLPLGHAQSQQLNLTAAQIKAANIMTVKPESLENLGQEISLSGSFSTSLAGGVAVSSLDAATVTEIFKENLSQVKAGESLLKLASEAWLRYQQEHVQNSTALNLARQNATRDKALFEDGLIAKRRLVEAQGQLVVAYASYQNSVQRLKLMGAAAGDIRKLESSGQLSGALIIRAPVAGTLGDFDLMLGQQVAPGSTLFKVIKPGALELFLSASPDQARLIKTGQTVTSKDCNGQLVSIGEVAGVATELAVGNQSIPVRVELDKKKSSLACFKANQFTNANVQTRIDVDVSGFQFKVPDTALAYVGSQAYVFIRSESGFHAVAVDSKRLSPTRSAIKVSQSAGASDPAILKGTSEFASSGTALLKGVLQGLGAE